MARADERTSLYRATRDCFGLSAKAALGGAFHGLSLVRV